MQLADDDQETICGQSEFGDRDDVSALGDAFADREIKVYVKTECIRTLKINTGETLRTLRQQLGLATDKKL